MSVVVLRPIAKAIIGFRIRGISPLITHAWSEKAKEMMRQKQQEGKRTKQRENRDPEAECMAAAYRTKDGRFGVPGMCLKNAVITAAHRDIGIERTLVRKALFLRLGADDVMPLIADAPVRREDMVRVGMGSADLRYRPEWKEWALDVEFEVDLDVLNKDDVLNLVDRAGFGVGICEWRPEKDGEFGRFMIDRTYPMTFQPLGTNAEGEEAEEAPPTTNGKAASVKKKTKRELASV